MSLPTTFLTCVPNFIFFQNCSSLFEFNRAIRSVIRSGELVYQLNCNFINEIKLGKSQRKQREKVNRAEANKFLGQNFGI